MINFTTSSSSVAKGETMLDTVNNILTMKVDMVVMRHSASGAPHFLAKHIPAAIVNAGDGINEHPTQALLDAFSIQEETGGLEGKKIAIIGDIMHTRVALSNIYLLKKMGAEVTVAGPPTLIPKYMQEAFDVNVKYNLKKRWNGAMWQMYCAYSWNDKTRCCFLLCANITLLIGVTESCWTAFKRNRDHAPGPHQPRRGTG